MLLSRNLIWGTQIKYINVFSYKSALGLLSSHSVTGVGFPLMVGRIIYPNEGNSQEYSHAMRQTSKKSEKSKIKIGDNINETDV